MILKVIKPLVFYILFLSTLNITSQNLITNGDFEGGGAGTDTTSEGARHGHGRRRSAYALDQLRGAFAAAAHERPGRLVIVFVCRIDDSNVERTVFTQQLGSRGNACIAAANNNNLMMCHRKRR